GEGRTVDVVEVGTPLVLQVTVNINQDIPRLVLGFMIKDRMGQPVYGINTHRINRALEDLRAGEQVVYRYAFPANIGKGNYSVALSLSRLDSHLDKNYEWRDFALIFHVINTRKADFVGTASLDATLEIQRNATHVSAEGAAC
ncbi:MAG: ABC transporter ATP-binding protein, partial [Pseudomonas sp.]